MSDQPSPALAPWEAPSLETAEEHGLPACDRAADPSSQSRLGQLPRPEQATPATPTTPTAPATPSGPQTCSECARLKMRCSFQPGCVGDLGLYLRRLDDAIHFRNHPNAPILANGASSLSNGNSDRTPGPGEGSPGSSSCNSTPTPHDGTDIRPTTPYNLIDHTTLAAGPDELRHPFEFVFTTMSPPSSPVLASSACETLSQLDAILLRSLDDNKDVTKIETRCGVTIKKPEMMFARDPGQDISMASYSDWEIAPWNQMTVTETSSIRRITIITSSETLGVYERTAHLSAADRIIHSSSSPPPTPRPSPREPLNTYYPPIHVSPASCQRIGHHLTAISGLEWPVFGDAKFLETALGGYFRHFHPQYPFVHRATFDPNTTCVQLFAVMIAVGCIWGRGLPDHRKDTPDEAEAFKTIGFAILEATTEGTFKSGWYNWDVNNFWDMEQHMALFLTLVALSWAGPQIAVTTRGFWTCDLLTMLKKANTFELKPYASLEEFVDGISGESTEELAVSTERAWRRWTLMEQRKRLSYCYLIWNSQSTATLPGHPHISIKEVGLPLCHPEEIWTAPGSHPWLRVTRAILGCPPIGPGPDPNMPFYELAGQFFHGQYRTISTCYMTISPLNKRALLAATSILITKEARTEEAHRLRIPCSIPTLARAGAEVRCPSTRRKLALQSVLVSLTESYRHHLLGPMAVDDHSHDNAILNWMAIKLYCPVDELLKMALSICRQSEVVVVVPPVVSWWVRSLAARIALWHCGQLFMVARRCARHGVGIVSLPLILFKAAVIIWIWGVLDIKLSARLAVSQDPSETEKGRGEVRAKGRKLKGKGGRRGEVGEDEFEARLFVLDLYQMPAIREFIELGEAAGVPCISLKGDRNEVATLWECGDTMKICMSVIDSVCPGGSLSDPLLDILEVIGESSCFAVNDLHYHCLPIR